MILKHSLKDPRLEGQNAMAKEHLSKTGTYWFKSLPLITMSVLMLALAESTLANDQIRASLGYEYNQGDYGNETTTKEHLLPFSLSWQHDDWAFKVSSAYINSEGLDYISSTQDSGEVDAEQVVQHQGLSDTTWSVRKELPWGVEQGIYWDLTFLARLPTATSSSVLYREADFGILLDLFWQQGRWFPMFSLGHKWMGDGDDLSLTNIWLVSAGAQYQFENQCSLGSILDYQQASSSDGVALNELMTYYSCPINGTWSVSPYFLTGFSDSSVDYGAGVQLTWRMDNPFL